LRRGLLQPDDPLDQGIAEMKQLLARYATDGANFLDGFGKSDRKLSPNPDSIIGDVRRVRKEMEASAYPGLPLYITEWSPSYNPRDKVHDSFISAPWILTKLRGTRGCAQAMSYWTYSDLFDWQADDGRLTRATTVDELRVALVKARAAERTTVVYVETDPLAPVPSSESWWDVPVAETSTLDSTTRARAAYDEAKRGQHPYLDPP
jgi:hypothetical protein